MPRVETNKITTSSIQIAQMVANNGGLASLLNVILCRKEYSPITAVLALGYIGAMSPILASAVIHSKVCNFNAILNWISSDTDDVYR